PGARFRPLTFEPTFQKHAKKACGGVQIHVIDRDAYRPAAAGVAFLAAARRVLPEAFAWRTRAYEFVADIPAIDLLAGSPALRRGIEAGASLAELTADWAENEAAFREERAPHLLY